MNILMGTACHKPYEVSSDPLYRAVQAGATGKESISPDWLRDDSGLSLSEKNSSYCELTVLYWLWKNRGEDALGLCHYRRYFAERPGKGLKCALGLKRAERLLEKKDAILPKKRHYWIETNYSQYVHAHHEQDLALTREILKEKYGEKFVLAFDESMKRSSGHRFNMLLMKRPLFDRYCAFLFDVLFELEKRLDISAYSDYDRRVFGFVGERLLDVYLLAEPFSYCELPVLNLESQHWPRKILAFLKRKFK